MIRLGLIGCGGISASHTGQFSKNSDRMKVTATCDIDPERAQQAAEIIGAPKWVTDYRDLLDDVDAVLLPLPHHLHFPIGMACLQAGKHVLMEKPLANTEAECLALVAEAEKRNLTLMTAYCMRYHPLVRKMKEVIDSGEFGEVFHLSLWTQQWTKFSGEDHWGHKIATLGGGQLFSHGCHYVDLMLWFLGEPIHGTHTGTNFGTEWMEREGTSDVSIKFANGAIGYHNGTWGSRGSKLHYCFQAHLTDGFLEANFLEGKLYSVKGKEQTELFHTTTGKHVQNEMSHFLDCIETGRIPETDALSSLQSLRVIWRLYEAEDAGKIADLRGLGLQHAGK